MNVPNIRSALAEHLDAYAEVVSSSSRQWAAELKRRIVAFIVAAFFTLLTVVVGIFVAILASWNTPYRWWVAGGVLVLCVAGVLFGVLAAVVRCAHAVHHRGWCSPTRFPMTCAAIVGEPAAINDAVAAMRLQESREQLHGNVLATRAVGALAVAEPR